MRNAPDESRHDKRGVALLPLLPPSPPTPLAEEDEVEHVESSSMEEESEGLGWTRRWRKDSRSLERVVRVVVKTVPPTLRRTHSSDGGVTVEAADIVLCR